MSHRPSLPISVCALALCCCDLATAQSPMLGAPKLSAGCDLQLVHEGPGLAGATVTMPASTEIEAGEFLSNAAGGLQSSLYSWTEATDWNLSVRVTASLSDITGSPCTANLPPQSVLVQMDLPRPMRLQFDLGVVALIGQGMPSTTTSIDIGDDDSPELRLVPPAGICDGRHETLVLDLPAGHLAVRLSFEGQLPVSSDPFACRAVCLSAMLDITAAHIEVTDEGGFCQQPLWINPLLDGESVQLGVYGTMTGGLSFLVLGGDTTSLLLPASSCSLLVQPDVVLIDTPWLQTSLPLGRYAPGHLHVQGAVWQPATWLGPEQLLTTRRHRLDLR